MFRQIAQWWANRQRGRERVAFDRGYQWAKIAMDSGSYTPDALLVLADGAFNDGAMARAWDKGVTTAASDRLLLPQKRNPPKRVKGLQHPRGETTTGNTGISV